MFKTYFAMSTYISTIKLTMRETSDVLIFIQDFPTRAGCGTRQIILREAVPSP